MQLSEKNTRLLAFETIAASFLILFQELALIRWLGSQIRVIAYFPNLVLLSAFLGIGIGCLLRGRRSLLLWWPASVLCTIFSGIALSKVVFTDESSSEHLWLLYNNVSRDAPVVHSVELPILLFFVLSTACFIPLGQILANRLQEFQRRAKTLEGYCWDILGSLVGVIAFTGASFLRLFPVVWFGVVFALGLIFFRTRKTELLLYALVAILSIGIVHRGEFAEVYSPYYALSTVAQDDGQFDVLTNGSLHQHALNFEIKDGQQVTDYRHGAVSGYPIPYRLYGKKPKEALIVGAGTGNDVTALLRHGAGHIDAVEIDPEIITLGKTRHPNHPYASDRVTIINDDARSFLNSTDKKYDLIVFGTLDSMTRLSALSNVRLDNFVYTLESIKKAKEHLTEDGGIILYFMVSTEYIHQKLVGILTEAFDELPLVHAKFHYLFNHAFMAGPAFSQHLKESRVRDLPEFRETVLRYVDLPNDDWPYLYLKGKSISAFYMKIMASIMIFALITIGGIVALTGEGSLKERFRFDPELFFFGMAFLLIETRSVTTMSLVWGTTWLTNSVVFAAILLMILLATVTTNIRPPSFQFSMFGLIVSLLIVYLVPPASVLVGSVPLKFLFSCLLVGVPIYFASVCFALLYKDREHAGSAFGWNILGAVAGGLLEFLSMVVGLQALVLIALIAYLFAFLSYHRKQIAG